MSDRSDLGILYTEHSDLRTTTPLASLWSYESCVRGPDRHPVALNRQGNSEYWLERSDPLLNTILPGTGVSVVVNFGDPWAAGRSLTTSALLPRLCVIGPVTQPRILRVGRRVDAVGAVFPPALTMSAFGVPASELVDGILALGDLWAPSEVERLFESLVILGVRQRMSRLRSGLVTRLEPPGDRDRGGHRATGLITLRGGRVSIDDLARSHVLSRQQFTRQFAAVAGLTPKLFARITRFQSLVRALLSSDVSEWASLAPAIGFYDQAHMINEFRAFAGSSPTVFFQPHDDAGAPERVQLRGRPSEWLRRPADDDSNLLARSFPSMSIR
jgi:AraC-like DNA-binding protein